jgi:GGDEF domain-containing protein
MDAAGYEARKPRSRSKEIDKSVLRLPDLEHAKAAVDDGALIVQNRGTADTVVRYGGDEFIVVMPETDLHQATVAVQRLHKQYLAQWNRANGDCGYSITVTCGVAEFEAGMTVGKLIHEADRLMLDAKSDGNSLLGGSPVSVEKYRLYTTDRCW